MTINTSGSKKFSVNFIPTLNNSGTDVFIEWAAVLTAAGWTAVDWSDGTTVTTSTTPATFSQLNNSNAWQRFIAPTGAMEIQWQRGTQNRYWKMYIAQDGFEVAGTATVMPTTTGITFPLVGTTSSFDITFTNAGSSPTANGYRWHMCVDSVPGTGNFYYFHMLQYYIGTGATRQRVIFSPIKTGTFPVEDTAPWACTLLTSTDGILNTGTTWQSYYKKGLSGETNTTALSSNNQNAYSYVYGANAYNGKHYYIRALLEDPSASIGQIKGSLVDIFLPASNNVQLPENEILNSTIAWTSTAGGDPGALIRYDNMLVPWPHNVALAF